MSTFCGSEWTTADWRRTSDSLSTVFNACRAVKRLMSASRGLEAARSSGPTLAPAVLDGQAKAWPRSPRRASWDRMDPAPHLPGCLAGTQGVRRPLHARLTGAGQGKHGRRRPRSARAERREERVDLVVRADGDAQRVLEPGLREVADEDVARRERPGHGPLIDAGPPREHEVRLRRQHAEAEPLEPGREPGPRRPAAGDVRQHGREVPE